MPDYKLIYFDGQGRGEIIRLIFAAAKVDYEDDRIAMDKWPQLKASTPMGGLPVLETQGQRLFQSLAISRFLARKFGLAGKSELDQVRVDIVVDTIEDIIVPIRRFWHFETDEKRKVALRNVYLEETLPNYLNNLEAILKSNGNGDGFFVGDGLTWADLFFLCLVSRFELQVKITDPLEKYPKLKALHDRVKGVASVAKYLSTRPETAF